MVMNIDGHRVRRSEGDVELQDHRRIMKTKVDSVKTIASFSFKATRKFRGSASRVVRVQ